MQLSNSLGINLTSSEHYDSISKEKCDDWPISKLNHLVPIGFEQFCMFANDIQFLPYKYPVLNVELKEKSDHKLKTSFTDFSA